MAGYDGISGIMLFMSSYLRSADKHMFLSCMQEPAGNSTPITWFNLPRWAVVTAMADRVRYWHGPRRFSMQRFVSSLRPSIVRPIFIIGAPRSGTTFLGRCLAALPEVSYHFEPVATKGAARYAYEGRWSEARLRRFYRSVYRWLLRIHWDGDLRFAEKTPRNCFNVEFLRGTFPDASFVHIIRDGRDAALSLRRQPWLGDDSAESGLREPGGYRYGPYPRFWVEPGRRDEFRRTTDLHRSIWSWRRHLENALEQANGLDAKAYLEIRYEELVKDPGRHAEELADFLGITSVSSRAGLRNALSAARTDSVGRWKEELTPNEIALIEAEAGSLLRRVGYSGFSDSRATLS